MAWEPAWARPREDQVHLLAEAILGREDIDVVDICTPQYPHRDDAVAAAGAGKRIRCEKPIARCRLMR